MNKQRDLRYKQETNSEITQILESVGKGYKIAITNINIKKNGYSERTCGEFQFIDKTIRKN